MAEKITSLVGPLIFTSVCFALTYAIFQIGGGEKECGGKITAYVMSQGFLKQRLKSPATAEFPAYSANDVIVEPQRECVYAVVAYVESQNGFGAMIRSRYSIEVEHLPEDGSWTARGLIVE